MDANAVATPVNNTEKFTITKDMIVAEIIQRDQNTIPLLMNAGMHCITCPASLGETLEEAAMVHGLDADDLCDMLNEYESGSEE
ncbi:MAG: DUF1858 domain-containing protein [Catonella sp.]|nr:DUF1858 domain-containing protein [Catonella sp.]MDY6355944.1 DUF1858 domain-containing protein [Catonella sp.]